jgi:hypothetical protein
MPPALARIVPFAVFIGFIAADGLLAKLAATLGMDPRRWYGIRAVVVLGLLIAFWRHYSELRTLPAKAGDWLLAVVLGAVVFVLWINLDIGPLTLGPAAGFDPRADGAVDWTLALTRVAGAVLIVPLMEELFWRSFVMRWIQNPRFLEVAPAQVGLKALAISSGIFALEHHLWFAGLLAGLAYGWLYIRAGNLWVPIASHAVSNGLLAGWVLYTGRWEFW